MRFPIPNPIVITGKFGATGGAYANSYFKRHIGVDLRASVGTPLCAPVSGVIRSATTSASGNKIIELDGDGKWHRFLHLSRLDVRAGQTVSESQQIGLTGNTGGVQAHCHWDVRKPNTAWNASFANYYNPETLVTAPAPPSGGLDMPALNSRIQLMPPDKRSTFRVGAPDKVGTINVTDNTFTYVVRGFDSKYPGRIIINSRSAGGDGIGLALYYLSGARIPGWKKI